MTNIELFKTLKDNVRKLKCFCSVYKSRPTDPNDKDIRVFKEGSLILQYTPTSGGRAFVVHSDSYFSQLIPKKSYDCQDIDSAMKEFIKKEGK